MTTSAAEIFVPLATGVSITDDPLSVDLRDGRTISVPLPWYPRLNEGSEKEKNNWRLIGNGEGIHWEDLDEDISVEGIIAGRRSGESHTSFKRWLQKRRLTSQ